VRHSMPGKYQAWSNGDLVIARHSYIKALDMPRSLVSSSMTRNPLRVQKRSSGNSRDLRSDDKLHLYPRSTNVSRCDFMAMNASMSNDYCRILDEDKYSHKWTKTLCILQEAYGFCVRIWAGFRVAFSLHTLCQRRGSGYNCEPESE
jgi:hypothetical protein